MKVEPPDIHEIKVTGKKIAGKQHHSNKSKVILYGVEMPTIQATTI